jgi:dienelactone hydrolase
LASHRLHAADLRTALDVCVGVRLGEGAISVDPARLGVAGHSTGGGAAVLAAAEDNRMKAVATFAVAETRPSAADAAARCTVPGLHLAGGEDLIAPAAAHTEVIAQAWRGPVTLRTLPKATHLGLTEGRHWSELLLHGRGQRRTRQTVRAMLAGFFLVQLTNAERYQPLLDEDVKRCRIDYRHGSELLTAS